MLSAGLGSLLVAGVATACATTSRSAEPSAHAQKSSVSPSDDSGKQNPPEIDEIAAYAEQHFPQSYTGVSAEGTTTVVHRVPRSGDALDESVTRRFSSASVRFADTRRTAKELDALTRRILADTATLRSKGVRVATVGPDVVRGVVVVTTDDVATARSLLTARYGDAVVAEGPAPEVTFAR